MKTSVKLKHPPIIEAVLDIDCDFSTPPDPQKIEKAARKSLAKSYPKLRPIYIQDHRVEATEDKKVKYSVEGGIHGLQFLKEDEKQLVQFRLPGFSFNRLSPYSSLDDYLPQIRKAWSLYSKLTSPVQVRLIRLRYINRVLLPLKNGAVDIGEYILNGPRLADPDRLTLIGFLDQYAALDTRTGYQVNSVLTLQPIEGDKLPIIFDNGVTSLETGSVGDWAWIRSKILELRELKNHIFCRTLTEKCLNLFQ